MNNVVEKALPWLEAGGYYISEKRHPPLLNPPLSWQFVRIDLSGFKFGSNLVDSYDLSLIEGLLKRSREAERPDARITKATSTSGLEGFKSSALTLEVPSYHSSRQSTPPDLEISEAATPLSSGEVPRRRRVIKQSYLPDKDTNVSPTFLGGSATPKRPTTPDIRHREVSYASSRLGTPKATAAERRPSPLMRISDIVQDNKQTE